MIEVRRKDPQTAQWLVLEVAVSWQVSESLRGERVELADCDEAFEAGIA